MARIHLQDCSGRLQIRRIHAADGGKGPLQEQGINAVAQLLIGITISLRYRRCRRAQNQIEGLGADKISDTAESTVTIIFVPIASQDVAVNEIRALKTVPDVEEICFVSVDCSRRNSHLVGDALRRFRR